MNQVAHVLRIASTVACGVVIGAFAFWATDEGRAGSDSLVAGVSASDGTAPVAGTGVGLAAVPAPEHDGIRGAVEDANVALLSPFDHVAQDGSAWAAHGIPALLALLTYGLLARVLIPYLPQTRR